MATKQKPTGRDLYRRLKAQGFQVLPDDKGRRKIIAPDGSPHHFHSSTFAPGSDANRSYRNALAQLVRAGFDPDVEEVATNGDGDAWRADRNAIDAAIAAQDATAATEQMEQAARSAVELDRARTLASIASPKARELYDRIAAEPGKHPYEYAEDSTKAAAQRASQVAQRYLFASGLVEATGERISRRWWLAGEVGDAPLPGMSSSGRPTAGPVRIRQQTPGDPLVVYKRLATRLSDQSTQLAATVAEMLAIHDQTHAELVDLRAYRRRMESILGRAVDAQ